MDRSSVWFIFRLGVNSRRIIVEIHIRRIDCTVFFSQARLQFRRGYNSTIFNMASMAYAMFSFPELNALFLVPGFSWQNQTSLSGCNENSDPENSDLRPQTPKTQTSKTQTPKTQTPKTQTSKPQTPKTIILRGKLDS